MHTPLKTAKQNTGKSHFTRTLFFIIALFTMTTYAPLYADEGDPLAESAHQEQESAQDPKQRVDFSAYNIKLIQAFPSKHFGKLSLPAFWRVEESDDRAQCRAIEAQEAQARIISLVLIDKIPEFADQILFKAFSTALLNKLDNASIVHEEIRESDKLIIAKRYFLHVKGSEDGVERDYYSLILYNKDRIFSINLVSPATRPMDDNVVDLLEAILTMME